VDKNAAVGDILVPSIVLMVILTLRTLIRTEKQAAFAAGFLVISGMGYQISNYLKHANSAAIQGQRRLLVVYDDLYRIFTEAGMSEVKIANTSSADFLFPAAINVMTFERHGVSINAREVLHTDLFAQGPDQMLRELAESDVTFIVTPRSRRTVQSPFQDSVAQSSSAINTYCETQMSRRDEFDYEDLHILEYVRPQLLRPYDVH